MVEVCEGPRRLLTLEQVIANEDPKVIFTTLSGKGPRVDSWAAEEHQIALDLTDVQLPVKLAFDLWMTDIFEPPVSANLPTSWFGWQIVLVNPTGTRIENLSQLSGDSWTGSDVPVFTLIFGSQRSKMRMDNWRFRWVLLDSLRKRIAEAKGYEKIHGKELDVDGLEPNSYYYLEKVTPLFPPDCSLT
jgi:hypothetical protein